MSKKRFTLIELLVVITIISILASMLFPSFQKMQDKALRTNSLSLCKNHSMEIVAYFTDTRKDRLPDLRDLFGWEIWESGVGTIAEEWNDPAGGHSFGYVHNFRNEVEYPGWSDDVKSGISSTHRFSIFDTEIALKNITDGHQGYVTTDSWGLIPRRHTEEDGNRYFSRWENVNNEESALMTTLRHWRGTRNLKPVAYGDGHAGISGVE